jgi:hypothetical protein
MIQLMNRRVNQYLGIEPRNRSKISADQATDALAALDQLGDDIREEIKKTM